MKKFCIKCKIEKDIFYFYKDKSKKDGYSKYCKECQNKYSKRWKKENQKKAKEYEKQYYKDNLKKSKEYGKQWRNNNPEKVKESGRQWARDNPEKVKEIRLKCNYGLSLEEYFEIIEQQKGCCAICERHQSELKIRLCVDHNHLTGKVRGLLCDNCNRMLGAGMDDPNILIKGAEYLNNNN